MAGLFIGVNSNASRINIPAQTSINNLDPWTFIFWGFVTGLGDAAGRFFDKATSTTFTGPVCRTATTAGAGNIQLFQARGAGTDCQYETNDSRLKIGHYCCVVMSFRSSTTPSAQILVGIDNGPITECSYGGAGHSGDGSGTPVDNSANALILCNVQPGFNRGFEGTGFKCGIWNTYMSIAQANLVGKSCNPQDVPGCKGFWNLGEDGIVTVLDKTGFGNHGTNTGGVSSAQPFPIINLEEISINIKTFLKSLLKVA